MAKKIIHSRKHWGTRASAQKYVRGLSKRGYEGRVWKESKNKYRVEYRKKRRKCSRF